MAELFNIIKKCKTIRDKAIPMLVKGEIKNFEKSLVNFVRSVNILYKDGIVSKRKYIHCQCALMNAVFTMSISIL